MAALTTGGSFLSGVLQVLIQKMGSREVMEFHKFQNLNGGLMEKLKTELLVVGKVINDAEERQISNPPVKLWLEKLRDVVYDAEDFLDEIAFEDLQLKVEANSRSKREKVWRFFFPYNPLVESKIKKLEAKLEAICGRLDCVVEQMDDLRLREGTGEKQSSDELPTIPPVDDSEVYGRVRDTEALIDFLLSPGKQLPVIGIYGMGGLGKTTLARCVYNDSSIQERFDSKAWVCVSGAFDVPKHMKDILKQVQPLSCDPVTENELQHELEKELTRKRVLIVLDDVWSTDQAEWDSLLAPFNSVAQGSKALVTTRSERVASLKSTFVPYRLREMAADDCWSLFAKYAFDDGISSTRPDLESIGKEIVRKCSGIPLAVKSLGGLLRSKQDVNEWENVLSSKFWGSSGDNILPALRLSYQFLPPQLKLCFQYVTIFPRGSVFEKDRIIRLWMAEGLLVPAKGNKHMEEVGLECFHDLVSRSFFQRVSSSSALFVVHDLLLDLAAHVSGEFHFWLEGDDSPNTAKGTLHFPNLATKFISPPSQNAQTLGEVMPCRLREGKSLRVLSFSDRSSPPELPDSIGQLKHLRYLDLSATSIKSLPEIVCMEYNLQTLILEDCKELAELPDSIGNLKLLQYVSLKGAAIKTLPASTSSLYNLQTLSLSGCRKLVELPTNMGSLISLHHLDIEGTNLREMPPRMGKLENLETLTDFFLGEQSVSSIKELGKLQSLRGALRIWNLQYIGNALDCVGANLKGKKHLKDLELRWDSDEDSCCLHLQKLPSGLQSLKVDRFHILDSLQKVMEQIGCCASTLEEITVRNCDSLELIPLELFPKLKTLEIVYCPNLESLCAHEGPLHDPSSLQFLKIRECPKLVYFPKGGLHAPDLEWLQLSDCINLKSLPDRMNSLLPSLVNLDLRSLLELESFPEGGLPSKLQSLKIKSCNKLIAGRMQWGLRSLPSLSKLSLGFCEDVKSFPDEMLLPSTLTSLKIMFLENLKFLDYQGLQHLTSLTELKIKFCPNLETMPEEGLPSSLSSLEICYCLELEKRCGRGTGEDWPKISRIPKIKINGKQIN